MSEHEMENKILSLSKEGKWKEIIDLTENPENYEARRILWVWPSIEDLKWIEEVISEHKLEGIISIGCGTGLLEWIIQQYTKCKVVGVEVDKSWWQSKYSPSIYLNKIIFLDDKCDINFPPSHALLFCYFNNGPAFRDYMKNYPGNIVFVIGPGEGQNRCTDPLPFDSKFSELGWILNKARKLDNQKDFIAVFTRLRSSQCDENLPN